MENKLKIRERLDRLPASQARSIATIARRNCGVHENTFRNVMKGTSTNLAVLRAIAQAAGITLDQVLDPEKPLHPITHTTTITDAELAAQLGLTKND